MSFKEPIPALSNVMDTNEHASSQITCGGDKDVAIGLILTGIQSLEVPGPGAVAHMSLHQKLTMSKSLPDTNGGQRWFPRFTPGDRLSVYVGDQLNDAVETVIAASVEVI